MHNRNHKTTNPTILVISALAFGFLSTGCSSLGKVEVTQPAVSGPKIPASVALVLTPEVQEYKDTYHQLEWQFGPAIADYARNTTQGVFERVQVYEGAGMPNVQGSVDAVLSPKVAKVNQLLPGLAWQDREILMVIEWTAKNPVNDQVFWVRSIEGQATETGGNMMTGAKHEKIIFDKLFQNLTTQTVKAFRVAPELQNLGR